MVLTLVLLKHQPICFSGAVSPFLLARFIRFLKKVYLNDTSSEYTTGIGMSLEGGGRDSESGSVLEVPACTACVVQIMCLPTPRPSPRGRRRRGGIRWRRWRRPWMRCFGRVNAAMSLGGMTMGTRATSVAETD
jgi:hypothetical protein